MNNLIKQNNVSKAERGLNGSTIKMIAIIAMLIDHIAWSFVPTESVLGQIMHTIGRLTGPIMCYFIAEGYRHTRSLKKYMGRLVIFALISVLPYSFYETGEIRFYSFGMIYTLALGLWAIIVYDRVPNKFLRWLSITGICVLSLFGDWPIFGVALCLIFHIYHDSLKEQLISMGILVIFMLAMMILPYNAMGITLPQAAWESVFTLGVFLPLFVLRLYNGKRGGSKMMGWFFYIFYPAHLIILGVIKYYG